MLLSFVVVVIGLSLLLRSSASGEQDVPSDAVLEAVRLLQDVKENFRLPVAGISEVQKINQRVQEAEVKKLLQDVKETFRPPATGVISDVQKINHRVQETEAKKLLQEVKETIRPPVADVISDVQKVNQKINEKEARKLLQNVRETSRTPATRVISDVQKVKQDVQETESMRLLQDAEETLTPVTRVLSDRQKINQKSQEIEAMKQLQEAKEILKSVAGVMSDVKKINQKVQVTEAERLLQGVRETLRPVAGVVSDVQKINQDVKETWKPVTGVISDVHNINPEVREIVLKSDEVVTEMEKEKEEMGHKKNVIANEKKPPQKDKLDQPSTPKSKLKIVGVRVDASSNSIPMEKLVGADTLRHTDNESTPDESHEVVSIAAPPNSEKISESFVKGRNGRARVVKMRRPISVPDTEESGSEVIDWTAFDPENVHDFEAFGRKIEPKNNKGVSSEPQRPHDTPVQGADDSRNVQDFSGISKVNEIPPIAPAPQQSGGSEASTRELTDGKSQSYKPAAITQTPTRSPTTAASTSTRKRVRIPSFSRSTTSPQVQPTHHATPKPASKQLRTTTTPDVLSNENELDLHRISSKSQILVPDEAPSFHFEPPPVPQKPLTTSSRLLRPASSKGNTPTTLRPQSISTTSKFLRPRPTTSSSHPSKSVRPVTLRRPVSTSTTKTPTAPVSSTLQPLPLSSLVPGAPFRAPITQLHPVSSLSESTKTPKPSSTITTHSTRKSTAPRVPNLFSTTAFDFSRIPQTSPSPTSITSAFPFSTSHRPQFNAGSTANIFQSFFTSQPTSSTANSVTPFSHPSSTASLHSPFTSLRPTIASLQTPISSPTPFVSSTEPTITASPHSITPSNPNNILRRPTVTTIVPSFTSRRPKLNTFLPDISSRRPVVTTKRPLPTSDFPDILKSDPSSLFTSPSSTTLRDDAPVTTSADPVTVINSPEPPFTGFSFQSFRPGSSSSSSFKIGASALTGSEAKPDAVVPQSQPQRPNDFSPSPLSTTSSDNFTPSSFATIGLFTSSTPGFGVRRRPTSFPTTSTSRFTPSQIPTVNSGPRITTFRPLFASPTTPRPQPVPSLLTIDTLDPVTPHTSFASKFSRPQTTANEIQHKPPLTSDLGNFPALPISNPNIFQILQQQSLHNFESQHLSTAKPRRVTTSHPRQILFTSTLRDQITTIKPQHTLTTTPRHSISTSTTRAPFFQFFSLGGKPLVTTAPNNPPSNHIPTVKATVPSVTTPQLTVTSPAPLVTSSRPVLTSPLPLVTTLRPATLSSNPSFHRTSSPRPTTAHIFEDVPSSISTLEVSDKANRFRGFSLNEDRPSLALFPHNALVNFHGNVLSPIPVTQPSITTPLSPFLAAFSRPASNTVDESQQIDQERDINLFRPHIQSGGFLPIPSRFTPTLPPIKAKFSSRPQNSQNPFNRHVSLSTAPPIITTARGPFTFDPSRFQLTTTQEPFVFRHTTTRRSITPANSYSNGAQATSLRPILREPSTIPPLVSSTQPNIPQTTEPSKAPETPSTWQLTRPKQNNFPLPGGAQSVNEVGPGAFTSPRPKAQTSFSSFGAVTSFESARHSTTAKPITDKPVKTAPTESSLPVNLHQPTTELPIQETAASTTHPIYAKRPVNVLPATAVTHLNKVTPTEGSFQWSPNKAGHSTRKPMLSPHTSPNVILQPAARSGSQSQSDFTAPPKNDIPSPLAKIADYSLKHSRAPKTLESPTTPKPRPRAKAPANVFRPPEPITGKSFIFVRSGGHEYRVVWL
ncbi:uncharacterized protein LOC135199715 [Macrobrachium nipponense]|uniref:uncharacterized protein LOC135199715 n=1 Tax=Macrobrachium nipponense TaxID=159736 RepID=UPI0030C8B4EE